MKKRILTILITLAMTMGMISAATMTIFADNVSKPGTWGEYKEVNGVYIYTYADFSPFDESDKGTIDNPYVIDSSSQLAGLAALVNAYNGGSTVTLTDTQGNTATATNFYTNGESQCIKLIANIDLSKYINLTESIELSGLEWIPIGTSAAKAFQGYFDGNGYTVSGISIGTADAANAECQYAGLFGYMTAGSIKNLAVNGVVNVSCSNKAYAGGIVGYANAIAIENCSSTVSVTASSTGTAYAGGLVGQASGSTIANCYSAGSVSGTTAGSFVGRVGSAVTINHCYWDMNSASSSEGSGNYTTGSPMELAPHQMKAAEGTSDSSWELLPILNDTGSLVDALNKYVEDNNSTETLSPWHIHEDKYPSLGNLSYNNGICVCGYDATNTSGVYVGGVKMNDDDYLESGASSVSTSAPASGGYAYYKDGVLTLHHYVYEGTGYPYNSESNYHALIYTKAFDLKIVLEGNSVLTSVSDDGNSVFNGIRAEYADVTVSGDGHLSIAADYYGMDFENSTLDVEGGTLDITVTTSCGFWMNGSSTFKVYGGSVQVEAVSGIASAESVTILGGSLNIVTARSGIYNTASININDGLLHVVTSGSAVDGIFAIEPPNERDYELNVVSGLSILLPENGTVDGIKAGVAEVLIADTSDHTFGSTYNKNHTHHWHPCTKEDCPFSPDDDIHQYFTNSGYAEHNTTDICVCGYDATKTVGVYVGGLGLAEGEYFSNSGEFSTTVPENEGYAYYSDGVLTLNNYEYSGSSHSAVYSEQDLTIHLEGESTLVNTADDGEGIVVWKADLVIGGSGTLNVTADYPISAYGNVSADSDDTSIEYYESKGLLTIQSGTLNITASKGGAIYADGKIQIDNGMFTIDARGDGIESNFGDISISGGQFVIRSAEKKGIDGNNGGSITITGGTTTIDAPCDEGIDIDLEGKFIMSDGTVTIEAGQDGIDCTDEINISGGTLTITAGESGLESLGDTTITGGTITLQSTDSAILVEGEITLSNMVIQTPDGGTVGTGSYPENTTVQYRTIVDQAGAVATNIELVTHTHDFTGDGVCECAEAGVKLMGSSLLLEGNIGMKIYFTIDESIKNDTTIKLALEDDRTFEYTASNGVSAEVNGMQMYVFTAEVYAKQMADTITISAFVGSNQVVNNVTHSVKDYAMSILGNTTAYEEYVPLIKAMLNYGAAAQVNFGYKTDDLSNSVGDLMTDAEKSAYTSVTDTEFDNYAITPKSIDGLGTFVGANLVLESETTMKVYFQPEDGVDIDALTFAVDGTAVTPVKSGSYYVIAVRKIRASDLDKSYSITVTNGMNSGTFTPSTFAYCASVMKQETDTTTYTEELKNVLRALYLYNAEANKLYD